MLTRLLAIIMMLFTLQVRPWLLAFKDSLGILWSVAYLAIDRPNIQTFGNQLSDICLHPVAVFGPREIVMSLWRLTCAWHCTRRGTCRLGWAWWSPKLIGRLLRRRGLCRGYDTYWCFSSHFLCSRQGTMLLMAQSVRSFGRDSSSGENECTEPVIRSATPLWKSC